MNDEAESVGSAAADELADEVTDAPGGDAPADAPDGVAPADAPDGVAPADAPDGVAPADAPGGDAPVAHARARPWPVAIALAVLAADQVTKTWVQSALADGHTVHLLGPLRLNLSYNSGMAFSRGRGLGPVIGVVALVLIVAMLASLRREGSGAGKVALGLVIGGAAGNITDRLFRAGGFLRGEVIDFIDLQFWPVFNVADAAISIGGALLVLGALLASRRAGP